jgi:hypothetical protein
MSSNILDLSQFVLYGLQSKWGDKFFKDQQIPSGEGEFIYSDKWFRKGSEKKNYILVEIARKSDFLVPMNKAGSLEMGRPGQEVKVQASAWRLFKPFSADGSASDIPVPPKQAIAAAVNFQEIASQAISDAPMTAKLKLGIGDYATIETHSQPLFKGFRLSAKNNIGNFDLEQKWPKSPPGYIPATPLENVQDIENFKPYKYYFDITKYTPGNIVYVGSGLDGKALNTSMSVGSVTHGQRVRANGVGASQTEIFAPSSSPAGFDLYQVNYSIQNSITANTVNGTSSTDQQGSSSGGGSTTTSGTDTYDLNTTTNSSSKTASWNVSSTVGVKTKVGLPLVGSSTVSGSLTAGGGGSNTTTSGSGSQTGTVKDIETAIQTNYSKTWSHVQGVNFSSSTGTSTTTGSTVSQSVNLSAIKENADGEYKFGQYTLIPGDKYEIYVSFAQVDVSNTIKGVYGIQGDIGEIQDSRGNIIDDSSFPSTSQYYNPSLIVKSIRQAQNRAASDVFGTGVTGFGETSLNGLYVEYEGTSTASTSVGIDGSWSFVQVVNAEDAAVSAKSSSSLTSTAKMLSASAGQLLPSYNLAQAQSHESVGVSLDLRNTSAAGSGVVKVAGTGAEDTVYASDHHGHQFSGFSDSFLYGGSKDDEAILSAQDAANSLLMKDGDDTVRAFSGQQADLGSGSDRYEVNGGGIHLVKTGNGYDQVVVNDISGFFQIADFDLTRDQLIFGDLVSPDSISMVLSDDSKDADPFSAYFNIYDGENQIGRVFLDNSLETSDFYLDSRLTLGHQILNSKGEELADDLTNYFEAYQNGKPGFSFADFSAIKDLSSAPQSIYDVSTMSHDDLTKSLHKSLINLGGDIERKTVSAFVGDNRDELTSSQMYGLFLDQLMPKAGLNYENFIS